MPRVDSSAVDRVEHDPKTGALSIWYKDGDRYTYAGVPGAKYAALLAAPSIGAYVNAEIKPFHQFELEAGKRRFRPAGE
jgi:hypothetical protein